MDMTETEFQIVKSTGFALAFALAAVLQRWAPHRRLSGNWRANSQLWALGAVVVGAFCAGLPLERRRVLKLAA